MKVFVDTNIIIDLLARRQHFEAAAKLFSLADRKKIHLYVSSLSIANINYILSRSIGRDKTLQAIRDLQLLVNITDLTGKIIQLALNDSNFKDFEDALQYYSAIEADAKIIITRNGSDFKSSILPVLTAEEYIKTKT